MVRFALPAYWVALAIATHYPQVQIPGEFEWRDKIVHASTFGLLAWLFMRFLTRKRPLEARHLGTALLVLVPYAALDEWTQQFFRRNTDIMDWLANITGISLVLAGFELWRRLSNRRRRETD